jgi:hypothetical protein
MPSQQAKLSAMREFEQDEKLMFNVVPAGRDAIQCVYAYPNTYTVGICSLGYQLVRIVPLADEVCSMREKERKGEEAGFAA